MIQKKEMKRSACLKQDLQSEDQELNRIYKSKTNSIQLKTAERLWIRFKDAECTSVASKGNESTSQKYTDRFNACLIARTKERINDLKSIV